MLSTPIKLVYFAWLRERVGRDDEMVSLDDQIGTVADLLKWQASRGDEYAYAFEDTSIVRVAVNQKLAKPETSLDGATEIAFFPPMTGG